VDHLAEGLPLPSLPIAPRSWRPDLPFVCSGSGGGSAFLGKKSGSMLLIEPESSSFRGFGLDSPSAP
jgi:hypothetical protein